jgi:hypothetical protein
MLNYLISFSAIVLVTYLLQLQLHDQIRTTESQ